MNIKNKYLTSLIVSFLKKYRLLNIIKYNKYIQNQTNIDYNDYKKFKEVEIEILLTEYISYNSDKKCFIFNGKDSKKNYTIYFGEEIIDKNYIDDSNIEKYLLENKK